MSNTPDKDTKLNEETKSNLEKEIVEKLLNPIQTKYNELIEQKKQNEREALELLNKNENEDLPPPPQTTVRPPFPDTDGLTDYETGTDNAESDDGNEEGSMFTDTESDDGTEAPTESDANENNSQDPEKELEKEQEKQEERKPEEESELDKPSDLTKKSKPDTSKLDATFQTLLNDVDNALDSKSKDNQKNNIKEENNRKKIEKTRNDNIKKIDSELEEKQNINSLISILSSLLEHKDLPWDWEVITSQKYITFD